MARYDVFRAPDGGLVLDCQSNWLRHYTTRFVVPLIPPDAAPNIAKRLNPTFVIDGEPFVMITQYASSMTARDLRQIVCSLGEHHDEIMNALDMLITDA
jgi:toxin CcdB